MYYISNYFTFLSIRDFINSNNILNTKLFETNRTFISIKFNIFVFPKFVLIYFINIILQTIFFF